MGADVTQEKRMRLRYAGVCRVCEAELPARAEAIWERQTKTVRCVECAVVVTEAAEEVAEPVQSGTAGASARREYERRRAKREERIRTKHPRLGGLILALSNEPQHTTAWATGAKGEERFGAALDERAGDRLRVLHDRRIPGSRANIDHIVVASTGVWVVDPKLYAGRRPARKVEGGLLRPRVEKLVVGGRDRTALVDGAIKQVGLVQGAVGDAAPVRGALCFIDADWPMFGGDFTVRGIDVVWPKKLFRLLGAEGPLDADAMGQIHRTLGTSFPSA